MYPCPSLHMGQWNGKMDNKHMGWGLSSTVAKLLGLPLQLLFPPLKNEAGRVEGVSEIKPAVVTVVSLTPAAQSPRITLDLPQPSYACRGPPWPTVSSAASCLLCPHAADEQPVAGGGRPQPYPGPGVAAGPLAG